jgi:Skp family chaperone for outer membrane proteins
MNRLIAILVAILLVSTAVFAATPPQQIKITSSVCVEADEQLKKFMQQRDASVAKAEADVNAVNIQAKIDAITQKAQDEISRLNALKEKAAISKERTKYTADYYDRKIAEVQNDLERRIAKINASYDEKVKHLEASRKWWEGKIAKATADKDAICSSCDKDSWTPDPSTIAQGQTFTQTNGCGETRQATGTKLPESYLNFISPFILTHWVPDPNKLSFIDIHIPLDTNIDKKNCFVDKGKSTTSAGNLRSEMRTYSNGDVRAYFHIVDIPWSVQAVTLTVAVTCSDSYGRSIENSQTFTVNRK